MLSGVLGGALIGAVIGAFVGLAMHLVRQAKKSRDENDCGCAKKK